jgi:hypothetical protein
LIRILEIRHFSPICSRIDPGISLSLVPSEPFPGPNSNSRRWNYSGDRVVSNMARIAVAIPTKILPHLAESSVSPAAAHTLRFLSKPFYLTGLIFGSDRAWNFRSGHISHFFSHRLHNFNPDQSRISLLITIRISSSVMFRFFISPDVSNFISYGAFDAMFFLRFEFRLVSCFTFPSGSFFEFHLLPCFAFRFQSRSAVDFSTPEPINSVLFPSATIIR